LFPLVLATPAPAQYGEVCVAGGNGEPCDNGRSEPPDRDFDRPASGSGGDSLDSIGRGISQFLSDFLSALKEGLDRPVWWDGAIPERANSAATPRLRSSALPSRFFERRQARDGTLADAFAKCADDFNLLVAREDIHGANP